MVLIPYKTEVLVTRRPLCAVYFGRGRGPPKYDRTETPLDVRLVLGPLPHLRGAGAPRQGAFMRAQPTGVRA